MLSFPIRGIPIQPPLNMVRAWTATRNPAQNKAANLGRRETMNRFQLRLGGAGRGVAVKSQFNNLEARWETE